MFVIQGRILTLNKLNDKSVQVVIKKQVKGKQTPIAIEVFGFWKDKMDALKLQKNDKIQGKVFAKSNLFKGKWYTNLYFNEIIKCDDKPKFKNDVVDNSLFESGGVGNNYIIDETTGEIIL
jgi:hypothetical protein